MSTEECIKGQVKVNLKNPEVSAKIMLIGYPATSRTVHKEAIITLGGVEVLRTPNEHFETDMQRIIQEIKKQTLLVDYKWDGSLMPYIEMLGEREKAIKKLNDSLRHKGYKSVESIVNLNKMDGYENAILYTSCDNGSEMINIGRKHFDTLNSWFFVQVLSRKEPCEELYDKLNHAEIVGPPSSMNWGNESYGDPKKFSYKIDYRMFTRTEPAKISKSLSRTASALVGILNS